MRLPLAVSLGFLMLATSASAHEIEFGTLVVVHPWLQPSPVDPSLAGGYFKVRNRGTEQDCLVEVTVHIAKREIAGRASADPGRCIAIPAGQTVKLDPHALHIEFPGLPVLPDPNTELRGTLRFEKAGLLPIEFEIVDPDEP